MTRTKTSEPLGGQVDCNQAIQASTTTETPPNYLLGVAACALTGTLFAVFVSILANLTFTH